MAEQQTPTFKLVLVGDGGTGKVCEESSEGCWDISSPVAQVYPAAGTRALSIDVGIEILQ